MTKLYLREELDVALLPFRLVKKRRGGGKKGWLQGIRQAIGIPVEELAERLGVCRWEIHRMEESEKNSRIMLATLKRAAKAMGCELVYALVPKEGTLEDLAAVHRRVRERALEEREKERVLKRKPWLEEIGFREKLLGYLRTRLRNEGFRVRPRKTNRGVEKQETEFKETVKLARLANKLGPLMMELASQQAGEAEETGDRE